ncbi:unnamed protein product [Auanema sp. JU1783]|nr:unnamed protein product [Auanema sp. JU1783]
MSERDSIVCVAGCACSVEACGLFAALPETQKDFRTSSVIIVFGLERMKYYIHQEIAHLCWLYTALDKESLAIINNGPMEAESFIERCQELHRLFRKLAHVNDNHDIKAAIAAWKLPTDSLELRSFVKNFVDHVQYETRKEMMKREDHLDQLKVFLAYLDGERWSGSGS